MIHTLLEQTDNACGKKFFWCSGQALVIGDYKWLRDQPNYFMLRGGQHCITHNVDLGGLGKQPDDGINDWECNDKLLYLCE